jgi:hypothetical protein
VADLHEEIARFMDAAAPPVDVNRVISQARRGRMTRRAISGSVGAVAVSIVVVVVAYMVHAGPSRDLLRVAPGGASSTTTTSSVPSAPSYPDHSRPPPLRIEMNGQAIDISTMLGCWFWNGPAASHVGHGLCADGVVDPARFVLTDVGATSLTIRSPVAGTVDVTMAEVPPPHSPRELPASPRATRALVVHGGGTEWVVDLPARAGPVAIYVDFRTGAKVRDVHGDGEYGFELRPR